LEYIKKKDFDTHFKFYKYLILNNFERHDNKKPQLFSKIIV